MPLKSIAVFCGSNFGTDAAYSQAARALGAELARRGITLVYGGTDKGLMGLLADAALGHGGQVIGVINQRLFDRGHLHPRVTRHEVVANMRIRKARMAALADAFIALPGGLGTLEELLEAATLTQLQDHEGVAAKPFAVFSVRGFYEPLLHMLAQATQEGFMKPEHRDMMVCDDDACALLDALAAWQPPTVTKWIGQPGS